MLTKNEILYEYGRCLSSPIYAIETYLETFDKTQEGYVPFKLFPRQKEIIRSYEAHRFNLVTKPRQAGVSTTTAAYMCVKVALADENNPEAVLIVANRQELAFEFLAKIKDFLEQMPRWFWGDEYYGNKKKEEKDIFLTNSKGEIVLPNGSRVKAVATSKGALRGFTPTYLIMDEAAHIENGNELFTAAITALGTGGRCVLISTPQGLDQLYYETYSQAKAGKNNFNIIEMKWYEDSRYNKDLSWIKGDDVQHEYEFTFDSYQRMIKQGYKPTSTWYEDMCRGMNNDARMIAQELDVSFIGSGGNVIAEEYIQTQELLNVKDPEFYGNDKNVWIWKQPEDGHQYIESVDVSSGNGKDYSTIVIIDFTTMEQVLEYQGKIQPDLLATLVEEYGNLYKAYTVVDITGGYGATTVLKLLEFGYKYLHYDTPNGKILSSKRKQMESHMKDDKIPGFQITNVRPAMIANLEEKIRNNTIKIRSIRLINEMKTFVFRNGRADHMENFHDDLLISLAMALWVLEHSFKNLIRLEKQTKAMLNSWTSSASVSTNHSNQQQYQNGQVKKQIKKPNFSPVVAKNMQDPKGQYMWLFSGTKR